MKAFHLGDILSITTGVLLSPSPGLSGIQPLLDYMTGDNIFTHQVPRAADECAPELLRQHPALAGIEVPQFASPQDYMDWLDVQAERYGTHLDVAPLAAGDHTVIDPLAEMAMNWPGVAVVPVAVNRKES